MASELIRDDDDDDVVYGDAGYIGLSERDEIKSDPHKSAIDYRINHRVHNLKKIEGSVAHYWFRKKEKQKSYKDHVKCDSDSKIITNFSVTDASVHDSQEFVGLVDEKDNNLKLDSGYVGEGFQKPIFLYNLIKIMQLL